MIPYLPRLVDAQLDRILATFPAVTCLSTCHSWNSSMRCGAMTTFRANGSTNSRRDSAYLPLPIRSPTESPGDTTSDERISPIDPRRIR